MNNIQALEAIKQVLDAAIKAGLCANLQSASMVATAFDIVKKTVEAKEEKK